MMLRSAAVVEWTERAATVAGSHDESVKRAAAPGRRSGRAGAQDKAAGESSALRAFAVLETIVRRGEPMSLDEVTHALALPKPTVFRILNLLHSADLLHRDALTRRYTIGARLTSFALDLWRQSTLRAQWHSALQEIVDELDETCNLTILEGNEVLYLDRVESSQPLRLHLAPGTRVPLHCTASGKLFLSRMNRAQRAKLLGPGPLKRYTARTITDIDELERALETIRETQVGTHDGELFEDSVAIAVPVLDRAGRMHAAVAVHAPSSRASLERCMEHLPTLRRAAARIAESLMPAGDESTDEDAEQPAPSKRPRRHRNA